MAEKRPPASNSIFSGVFNYVADEVGSFITNATGGVITVNTGRTSHSRVKSTRTSAERSGKRRKKDRDDCSSIEEYNDNGEHRGQGRQSSHEYTRRSLDSLETSGRGARDMRASVEGFDTYLDQHTDGSRRDSLSRSDREAQAGRRIVQRSRKHSSESLLSPGVANAFSRSSSLPSPSPPPPPLPKAVQSKSSITMPGSLFPRSPSMVPTEAGDNDQHVHFDSVPDSNKPGPSRHRLDTPETSSFRKPLVPSVRDAVGRFQTSVDDADPSILLPSPSPHKALSKGKAKANPVTVDSDDEGNDRDSILMPPPLVGRRQVRVEEYPLHINDGDTSGEIRMKGKQRELVEAKEEHRRNQRRWERDKGESEEVRGEKERDKERIRMLEEEVARLKEELSKRPARHPTPLFSIPPPPPPPPPPVGTIIRAPVTECPAPFASARAALKHAPTPVEAPINPLHRKGQPTVGITADKMAAFLNEMKTVRLRKVSSATSLGSNRSSIGIADTSSRGSGDSSRLSTGVNILERDDSFNLENSTLQRSMYSSSVSSTSVPTLSSSISSKDLRAGSDEPNGNKRKRTDSDSYDIRHELEKLTKRRSLASSSDSSFASTSTSKSNTRSDSTVPASTSYILPPGTSFPSRAWAPSAILPVATPSLCSDNDVERGETSPDTDDFPPSTPPVALVDSDEHKEPLAFSQRTRSEIPEIIDVDVEMDDDSRDRGSSKFLAAQRPATPYRKVSDAFSKRPPGSPLPTLSPNRPRPPARSVPLRIVPSTPPYPRRSDSDNEDPLSLNFTSPDLDGSPSRELSTRTPPAGYTSKRKATSQARPKKANSSSTITSQPHDSSSAPSKVRGRRRPTLDEELRIADKRSMQAEAEGEEPSDEDLDSGVLTGVGMKNQKGFLAHGGAGGPPVYMGPGYVQGAEEECDNSHSLAENGTERYKRLQDPPGRSDAEDDENRLVSRVKGTEKASRIAVSSRRIGKR